MNVYQINALIPSSIIVGALWSLLGWKLKGGRIEVQREGYEIPSSLWGIWNYVIMYSAIIWLASDLLALLLNSRPE